MPYNLLSIFEQIKTKLVRNMCFVLDRTSKINLNCRLTVGVNLFGGIRWPLLFNAHVPNYISHKPIKQNYYLYNGLDVHEQDPRVPIFCSPFL